jgi:hypothetical protein
MLDVVSEYIQNHITAKKGRHFCKKCDDYVDPKMLPELHACHDLKLFNVHKKTRRTSRGDANQRALLKKVTLLLRD